LNVFLDIGLREQTDRHNMLIAIVSNPTRDEVILQIHAIAVDSEWRVKTSSNSQ